MKFGILTCFGLNLGLEIIRSTTNFGTEHGKLGGALLPLFLLVNTYAYLEVSFILWDFCMGKYQHDWLNSGQFRSKLCVNHTSMKAFDWTTGWCISILGKILVLWVLLLYSIWEFYHYCRFPCDPISEWNSDFYTCIHTHAKDFKLGVWLQYFVSSIYNVHVCEPD